MEEWMRWGKQDRGKVETRRHNPFSYDFTLFYWEASGSRIQYFQPSKPDNTHICPPTQLLILLFPSFNQIKLKHTCMWLRVGVIFIIHWAILKILFFKLKMFERVLCVCCVCAIRMCYAYVPCVCAMRVSCVPCVCHVCAMRYAYDKQFVLALHVRN